MTSVVPVAAAGLVPQVLGWIGFLLTALAVLVFSWRRRELRTILLVAFVLRMSAAIVHFYVVPLPDGVSDAVGYERVAWALGKNGLLYALEHYPGLYSSFFYSWLMSLIYSVVGRSLLLLQSLSVFVGVCGVVALWRLTLEVWDRRVARKAAWAMALFPTVIMYSALTMREVWFVLFILVGFIGVAKWTKLGGGRWAATALLGFFVATLFHGGAFVAFLGFVVVLAARAGRTLVSRIRHGRLSVIAGLTIAALTVALAAYVGSGLSVNKLGSAQQMVSPKRWMLYFETRDHGEARYPEWTQPHSTSDLLWAVPLRAAYLLFSPFPWDIRKPAQLVGLFDGALYILLAILIWSERRTVWRNPSARVVLMLLVLLVVAYGVGTGNFGTALRHRAKLVAILIALAGPRLPRLRVLRKDSPVG